MKPSRFCWVGLAIVCVAEPAVFHDAVATPTMRWTRGFVVGLDIELDDAVAVESMNFTKDGFVPITLGVKKGRDSWLTAPLYYWKIVSGRLRISKSDGTIYDEFTLLSRSASRVTVRRRSGEIVTFKFHEHPKA